MIQDSFFSVGVNTGKRIVENQNARISDNGTGNGAALLLSAGKGYAALPHHGFILLRESLNVCGNISGFSGRADLFFGGTLCSESNVIAHSITEQKCFLRD